MSLDSGISLKQIALTIGARLEGDPEKKIIGINTLRSASSQEISFIARDSFAEQLSETKSGALICSEDYTDKFSGNKLIGEDPYLLYAKCTKLFKTKLIREKGEVSKMAYIGDNTSISKTASISSFVTISDGVEIHDDVIIGSGVFIGPGSVVRKGTLIYPNVTVYDSVFIGSDCVIHSGAVLGSDGLGFAKEEDNWVKIEHLGKVLIGDNVEIGSNTSIDRGSVGDTQIEDDVKIDNLVHLAHNVFVGKGSAIAANSAIAGSSRIGRNCTMAGCSAIIDNVEVTDEVHITAMTLITKSIKEKGIYSSGTPFMKNSEWKRNAVSFKRLHNFITKEK